jgi:hypothetical protein
MTEDFSARAAAGLPFAGVVVSRVRHDIGSGIDVGDLDEQLEGVLERSLVGRVNENFDACSVLVRRDQANVAKLAEQLDRISIRAVPHFEDDVHDLDGLVRVCRYLFASAAERDQIAFGLAG